MTDLTKLTLTDALDATPPGETITITVDAPQSGVLDDVSRGVVTAEAVDTLREVYPRLYEEARSHLLLKAPDVREALPHQLVVRMSALFDVPLISSMEPETIAAIQAIGPAMAPTPSAPAAPAMTPAPGGAPNVSDMFMTGADRRAR